MFSKMLTQLKAGQLPSADNLASLLKVALIKKQGVLQQPPACWSNDPKINPDATHLLWAATLLGKEEEIVTAVGAMMNELMLGPRQTDPDQRLMAVKEKLVELVALSPNQEFGLVLQEKVSGASQHICQLFG